MKRLLRAGWALFVAALAVGANAALAASTLVTPVSPLSYVDLGAAPIEVQSLDNPIQIVVADSAPTSVGGRVGIRLTAGSLITVQPADSSSHVYAQALGAQTANVSYTPVYASGGASISTVTQGNAGSNAQAWWAEISDATNGPVAVKPASTPPAATDLALVVALSPNGNQAKESGGNLATIAGAVNSAAMVVKQATAANLNATVVGTGMFATQSAITAASGAVASGAVASGAFASGAISDGADVTLGAKADAKNAAASAGGLCNICAQGDQFA